MWNTCHHANLAQDYTINIFCMIFMIENIQMSQKYLNFWTSMLTLEKCGMVAVDMDS